MSKVVPVQFRPAVIIFVGETATIVSGAGSAQTVNAAGPTTGGTVAALSLYEYFRDLSALLDQALLPAIGMLAVEDGSQEATLLSFGRTATSASSLPKDNFIRLARTALSTVQGHRLKYHIEAAGYAMPRLQPQVYIVGQTQSVWVSKVAEWINQALAQDRSAAFIAYLLVDAPPYTGSYTVGAGQAAAPAAGSTMNWLAPTWIQDLQAQQGEPPLVDFCFLYEEEAQDQTYQEVADMRYALAEALFALIATNLTAAPTFCELTATTIMQEKIEERIGNLATSMIQFPRAAIESYCADMHGVEVIQCQIKKLQQTQTSQQTKQLRTQTRSRAQDDANTILDNLWENVPHPYVNDHYWADLAFMENEDQKVRLHTAAESIFQAFAYQRDWAQNVNRQVQQAERAYRSWQAVMRQVWDVAGQEIQRRVGQTMNQLLLDDDTGFLARIYAEQMDSMLDRIYDRFMQLRVDHYRNHTEEIQVLRERGDTGPWVIPPNVSPLLTTPGGNANQQAAPTLAGATTTPAGGAGSGSGTSSSSPTPQTPIANRSGIPRTLAANLNSRVKWMRNTIPDITNMVGAGILVVPPFILLLLALLPASWAASPVAVLALCIGIIGSFALICWLYRYRTQQRVLKAEEDVLHLYRCHFAYQCEQWEDKVRAIILGPLVKKVRLMRLRLENMQQFTEHLSQLLRQMAEQTEEELFNSPGAYRDVLVGDGQILGKHADSLAILQECVQQLRVKTPAEEWHQSYESINKQMHREFMQRNISILDATSEQDLLQPISAFCRTVILPYLKDELVEIEAALHPDMAQSTSIWKQALKNALILYLPHTNAPEFLYICGRDEHRSSLPAKIIPQDATMIRTKHAEWLLVGRFWSGGATTRWTFNFSGIGTLGNQLPQRPQWPTR